MRRGTTLLVAGILLLAGCTNATTPPTQEGTEAAPTPSLTETKEPPLPLATLAINLREGATDVKPVPALETTVEDGKLLSVDVTDSEGTKVPGTLTDSTWSPTNPLTFGGTYKALSTAINPQDGRTHLGRTFTVLTPSDKTSIEAEMMPIDGETVGVGMPIVVYLTNPVDPAQQDALLEELEVTPSVPVTGAWRWFSDTELHWRPQTYWPANTDVNVKVNLAGFDGGNGNWGIKDRDINFKVGNSNISTVNLDTHQMTTIINGETARTFPVSGGREDGDPTWVTRSGVHLVLSKHADYTMDGASAGAGDYLTDVKWATRISNSGEFVHAAPWSVNSQGKRNVSHGCVNANNENARWFYQISQRGDVVDVKGTGRPMELTNGLGDWTLTWEQWTTT